MAVQVRDILYIEDLVRAFVLAHEQMPALAGQAFNIGGGAENTISLLELVELITELQGKDPVVRFDDWRTADQQYYVSDVRKFGEATGWRPQVDVHTGIAQLTHWLKESARVAVLPVVLQAAGMWTAWRARTRKPFPSSSAPRWAQPCRRGANGFGNCTRRIAKS